MKRKLWILLPLIMLTLSCGEKKHKMPWEDDLGKEDPKEEPSKPENPTPENPTPEQPNPEQPKVE
jgi:hypothetical protein